MHIKINSIIINEGLIDKISSIYLTLDKAILPVDLSWTDSIDEGL